MYETTACAIGTRAVLSEGAADLGLVFGMAQDRAKLIATVGKLFSIIFGGAKEEWEGRAWRSEEGERGRRCGRSAHVAVV